LTNPTPFFETGEPVPYVGIISTVPMTHLSDAASGFGQIYSWLGMNGFEPSGPALFRYREFHKNGLVTLEIGVPADVQDVKGPGLLADTIPGGRYLSLLHPGDYSGLQSATHFLLKWADEHRLKFQVTEENDVSLWKSRLEWYLIGPKQEPDPAERRTKISILLV